VETSDGSRMRESGMTASFIIAGKNLNHKRGTVGTLALSSNERGERVVKHIESGPISPKTLNHRRFLWWKQQGSATHREFEVETKPGRPVVK
jgi:hypothetical protein